MPSVNDGFNPIFGDPSTTHKRVMDQPAKSTKIFGKIKQDDFAHCFFHHSPTRATLSRRLASELPSTSGNFCTHPPLPGGF